MPDPTDAHLEEPSIDRGRITGSSVGRRVIATTDDLLQEICSSATELLDDALTDDAREACLHAASGLARWLGSMNLAAEASLARQIEAAFREQHPAPTTAVRVAGLVDDIRNSVGITVGDGSGQRETEASVVAIGNESMEADADIWVLATSGFSCHAATPWDPPALYPDQADCIVVLAGTSLDAPLVRALRERYPTAAVVVSGIRTDIDPELAAWATTILDPGSSPDELVEEIRLQITVRARPVRVAVAGRGSKGVATALRKRGGDVVAIGSTDDLAALTAGNDPTRVEALVVGADVGLEALQGLVRRVRTDPLLRDALILQQVGDGTDAGELHDLGVDVVVAGDAADDRHALASQVERLVHRARRLAPREAGRRRTLAPATTRIMLERLLVTAHRDGRTVSVAVLELPPTVDPADLAADLTAEFRTNDVVGVWEGGTIVVALRGLARRVAVERIRGSIGRHGAEDQPARAGVAEFPYDARSVDELVDVAHAAMDRARASSGPRVVGSDWRVEADDAPDVMIVDPDEMLTSVLSAHLTDKGLAVTTLGTGGEAADWLVHDRRPTPRVLLLEFNTPGLDGLQLLRQLRKFGVLNRMRVLMLSATLRDDDLLEAFALGAWDMIAKPFSMAVFDNRLNRVLDS